MDKKNVAKKDTEPLNVTISREIFEIFQTQWQSRGQVKNKAAEAAMRLWISLTPEMQATILATDHPHVLSQLVDMVKHVELSKFLDPMDPEDMHKFFALVLELSKRFPPRK